MVARDFIVYRYPGKPPTRATDNGFEDKILLCCSAVLYEILYKDVFGMDEEELRSAVEVFRSGSKKNRNSAPVGSEDANFGCLHEKVPRNPSEKRLDEWEGNDTDNPQETKFKQGIEEQKPPENPPKMPVPYKVLKALDSTIYRNVEFDVWLDSRKELQKTDYMVFAGRQYYLGDKCQVCLEPGEKYYNAHIQEVGQDSNTLTVFVEELAENSYSRSRRPLQCGSKECHYGFVTGAAEEPQGPEGTVTFCEIEGDDDTAFPALPVSYEQRSHSNPAPIVHGPGTFWVARRSPNSVPSNKQTLSALEEEEEASENGKFHEEYIYAPPDPNCETATVFSSAEPTANLEEGPVSMAPPDEVAPYSYPQKVLVNSATVSTSTDVYTAPATGLSSNSAASTPASVITAAPPQTAVQPVIVSPFSVGRPVSEVGEASAVLPAYSCDPSGSDLPRDTKVLRYYFNMGLQYCHQSCWPSMMYMQPVLPPSPVEVYPAYAEPAPVLDQSVPQLFPDAGQAEVHQVPLEASANGNFQNTEPPPLSYGPVYYPVVSDPFSQQPLPGFDSVVPAYHYIGTWHPVNPPHGNSPPVAKAGSSGAPPQVGYMASPNPAPPDAPQGILQELRVPFPASPLLELLLLKPDLHPEQTLDNLVQRNLAEEPLPGMQGTVSSCPGSSSSHSAGPTLLPELPFPLLAQNRQQGHPAPATASPCPPVTPRKCHKDSLAPRQCGWMMPSEMVYMGSELGSGTWPFILEKSSPSLLKDSFLELESLCTLFPFRTKERLLIPLLFGFSSTMLIPDMMV
ncbi:hypothetical protein IHE44_0003064 [Lamprotornis superbus]|uniref:Uncharacterized protein n=1 Tax=Lamprotornis superbus TaxID=245042 RepID=A0A835NUV8_9PASS|nr:hypothetical protein IHE44_0003064 [Lamprotornis superbus]